MTMCEIAVDKLVPGDHNPREAFDDESLNELAATIRERGVLQPLRVREAGDGFEIICGERRWAAAVAAGLETVPCIVVDCDDNEALIASGIENIQRDDLTPVEVGQWLSAVRDSLVPTKHHVTAAQVAAAVGKSQEWVDRYLGLVDHLPKEIAEKVTRRRTGDTTGLSEAQAEPITRLADNPQAQRDLADKVEREDLNYKEVRAVAKAVRAHPDKADEILSTDLRAESEKSGQTIETVVESIVEPITIRGKERASATEFGVITEVKGAALKLTEALEREGFRDLVNAADENSLRMMRESLRYANAALVGALAAIDDRLGSDNAGLRMAE